MSPDQETPQLFEVTMFFIFNLSHAPKILSSLDNLSLWSLNILITANDSKRHGDSQVPCMISSLAIILIDRRSKDFDSLCGNDFTNTFFEETEIGGGEGICFCDDRDEVDAWTETFHDFDVQGAESVACGTDKVETGMDSEIDFVLTFGLLFLTHVGFVLLSIDCKRKGYLVV
jgi:hypothetical protein